MRFIYNSPIEDIDPGRESGHVAFIEPARVRISEKQCVPVSVWGVWGVWGGVGWGGWVGGWVGGINL